jgi:hypothetical protein
MAARSLTATRAVRGAPRLCVVVEQSSESTTRSTRTGGHSRQERAAVACAIPDKSARRVVRLCRQGPVVRHRASMALEPPLLVRFGMEAQFNTGRGFRVRSRRMTVRSGSHPVGPSDVGPELMPSRS